MVMVISYGVSPGGPQRGGARRVLRRPLGARRMFATWAVRGCRMPGFRRFLFVCAGWACPKIDCNSVLIKGRNSTARTTAQPSLPVATARPHHVSIRTSPLRLAPRAPRARRRRSYTPMLVLAFPLEPCTPGFHATGHITHTSGRSITVGHVRSNMGPMPSTHCGASTETSPRPGPRSTTSRQCHTSRSRPAFLASLSGRAHLLESLYTGAL